MKSETAASACIVLSCAVTMPIAVRYMVVTLCCSMLAVAKDNKAEAKALLDRNRSLTQMRSAGDPSFKLRAAFTYQAPGRNSPTVEGMYELHWASPDQWKETFQAGDTRVTRVFTQG